MTKTKTIPSQNREAWLHEAVDYLAPLIENRAGLTPHPARVSVGWPSSRGMSVKKKVIGECWATKATQDGVAQVFISPILTDGIVILGTLVHELIHAYDDCKSKHGGAFARAVRAVGLEGKPTATEVLPGSELHKNLTGILDVLGPFPSAGIIPAARREKVQSTRMLKLMCLNCGCIVRMTRKWLDDVGEPTCGCGFQFEEVEAGG
jgi:hypothetical protein